MRRIRPRVIVEQHGNVDVSSSSVSKRKSSEPDDLHTKTSKLVFQIIQESIEERQSYYRVFYFTIFVFTYMAILYAQGALFQSYDVVSSLREAVAPSEKLSSTFTNEAALLDYIGRKLVLPIWEDPVCGDDKCQWPWEFPAFGRFGCKADCGIESNTTKVLIQVRANFGGELTLSPRTLMSNVNWNVCLNDTSRSNRGQEAICWFAEDQIFTEIVETRFETMDLIAGQWFIKITGDFMQKVNGRLFDISNPLLPAEIETQPQWSECKN